MSRADAQLRIFETLWDELRPRIATDRNLPARIQQRLAKEKRFGSRDRRLYRELLYTALRYLPWLENDTGRQPVGGAAAVLWLASDSPATLPLKRELLASAPPCPPTITERAALLGQPADALLPEWFRAHCPAAFEEPDITALHTRAPLWLRLQTDNPAPVFAEFAARGWKWKRASEGSTDIPVCAGNLPPSPHRQECLCHPSKTDALELLAANDPDLTQTDAYRRGLVEIQDFGSQLVLAVALNAEHPSDASDASYGVRDFSPAFDGPIYWPAPSPSGSGMNPAVKSGTEVPHSTKRPAISHPRWLDACAGAGGKTLQLARILGPDALVDATDPRPAALAELRARAARAGVENIRVLQATPASADASASAPALASGNPKSRIQNPKSYDGVLVDAPCSGTGTWRRNPHLKYCVPESAIHAAAKLQLEILARHAPLVRAGGGVLIYATCSLSRVENENVVGAFLADPAHRDFSLARQATILPAAHNTDGFFTATLRRGNQPLSLCQKRAESRNLVI